MTAGELMGVFSVVEVGGEVRGRDLVAKVSRAGLRACCARLSAGTVSDSGHDAFEDIVRSGVQA